MVDITGADPGFCIEGGGGARLSPPPGGGGGGVSAGTFSKIDPCFRQSVAFSNHFHDVLNAP